MDWKRTTMLNFFSTQLDFASRVARPGPNSEDVTLVVPTPRFLTQLESAWSWWKSLRFREHDWEEFSAAVKDLTEFIESAQTCSQIEDELRRCARELAQVERASTREQQPGDERVETFDSASTSLRVAVPAGQDRVLVLELSSDASRTWSEPLIRRLEVLARIAALGRRALSMNCLGGDLETRGCQTSSFLWAFLPHALAQARRRREPLTLFCVGVDRLAAIREMHGLVTAEKAVGIVAATLVNTLRSSDVVARFDDGRVAAVLPNAGGRDALTVAEAVRRAIAKAGIASVDMPILTSSIGVACYPDDGEDAESLIKAAGAGLAKARGLGRDRVAVPDHEMSETMLVSSPTLTHTLVYRE